MVETDASDYALVAVLSICTLDSDYHPVAFHSQTFKDAEMNYDVHDKELTAIYDAFKRWQHYLKGAGTPINIVTDHQNLQYFVTMKVLTQQQARCLEFLSQFNMIICFRPGKLGTKPDTLTCHWDGTFTQKRGVATTPVSTHRTCGPYSLMSNWLRPFTQLPSGYQPCMVH